MKRVAIVMFQVFIGFGPVLAQSLKRPSVTEPSLKLIKIHKYHPNAPGSMGLFDWNFSGGYIDKTATVTSNYASPVDIATTGQYLMFHLQESVLSNYFLAKRSRRYKRFKIGFQNTIDLGIKRGAAADETSDYSLPSTAQQGKLIVFLNYQAGIATALRITSNLDVGYTYYFYVRSIFSPNTESYSKARLRVGHFMGEYSFGGMNAAELKYIHSRKVYYGLGYTKYNAVISNTSILSSDIHTNWYHVSIGRVF